MSNFELEKNLKQRTKQFAVAAIRYCSSLRKTQELSILAAQLIRSASSVGANYRSACRARSTADFLSKLSIVEEGADEALYWLEILESCGVERSPELRQLQDEADQLTAIVVSSKKTIRTNGRLKEDKSPMFHNSKFDTRNSKLP